jgi:pectin methylesterase-like acyl-CoA thioesterase
MLCNPFMLCRLRHLKRPLPRRCYQPRIIVLEDRLVPAPISAISFAPDNGAAGICIDSPLSITFDQAPLIGHSGTVGVHRVDGSLIDTIDLADPNSFKRFIGGAQAGGVPYAFNYYPIIITGHTAAIYLHQALDYGQTYYVTMDPGVITDVGGAPFDGISDPNTWRFSTKPAGPADGSTRLTVAADNSGDFCTVQGAIDFVPQNNTQRVVITVRSGTYNEIDYVRSNKPFLTVAGEDRAQTVVQYPNNSNFNGAVSGNFRAMFGEDAADFVLTNITLHNTTPHGGSQAEAFRSGSQRILLNHVNLMSFQDTLLLQGKGFVNDSYIEGDVDFMWGVGTVFFQNCELKAVTSNGYYTMIRNPQGVNGDVFVNCRLTRADDSITGSYLSRIDPNVFPYSQVVYIHCAMGPHIRPVGWLLNNATEAPTVEFWEYNSTDLSGNPLDVSQRAPVSRQLTAEEAAQWSDPAFVLGGWVPETDLQVASVIVNDGSAQRSMVNSLTVSFSNIVHFDDGAFELLRQGGGSFDVSVATSLVAGHTVATLTFSGTDIVGGSLADGHYTLTVHGNLVHDDLGQALDGAGTGLPGSDRTDAFFRLFGDSDGDGHVDLQDLLRFAGTFGKRAGDPGYLWFFDYDGDGSVDFGDLLQLLRRLGR